MTDNDTAFEDVSISHNNIINSVITLLVMLIRPQIPE